MTNGGCMIYSHCVLKFDKDSVQVSYPTIASCSPTELEKEYNSNNYNLTKKYKWIITSDKLVIKGFEDLNKYSFQEKNAEFVKTLYPANLKMVRGFVFRANGVPEAYADVYVKSTNRKTRADKDGKFVIEAEIGEELRAESNGNFGEISVTDKNCYKIYFRDSGLIFYARGAKRAENKIARKTKRKIKAGFYDCDD